MTQQPIIIVKPRDYFEELEIEKFLDSKGIRYVIIGSLARRSSKRGKHEKYKLIKKE